MTSLKSRREIELMRQAGQVVAQTLQLVRRSVTDGVTTRDLDRIAEEFARSKGAIPAFKGYRGFPASLCVSINDEVVHGIPGGRVVVDGDIVSVDFGVKLNNYYGDAAVTVPVGNVSDEAQQLIRVTEESLARAIAQMVPGRRLSDVSRAVQQHVESHGFSVVRQFVGHAIGRKMHEDPKVPNFVEEPAEEPDLTLKPGLVLAIEPMVNAGTYQVRILKNGWTVVTRDGRLSAHFEHTVAVDDHGPDVLTQSV